MFWCIFSDIRLLAVHLNFKWSRATLKLYRQIPASGQVAMHFRISKLQACSRPLLSPLLKVGCHDHLSPPRIYALDTVMSALLFSSMLLHRLFHITCGSGTAVIMVATVVVHILRQWAKNNVNCFFITTQSGGDRHRLPRGLGRQAPVTTRCGRNFSRRNYVWSAANNSISIIHVHRSWRICFGYRP